MSTPPDAPVLQIRPAPTDAELAAIAIAVALLRETRDPANEPVARPPQSRWARAARLAAMGLPGAGRAGWADRH